MPDMRTPLADWFYRTQIRSAVCGRSSAIPTVLLDRRPVGAHRQRRGGELCEWFIGIDYFAAHYRQHGLQMFDLILGNRKIVGGEHTEIG